MKPSDSWALPADEKRHDLDTRHSWQGADAQEPYLPCVSPQMQALAASLSRVAATDAPVLISGETGTGKSTLAQQVYVDSPRRALPLIILHSASTTVAVVDSLAQLGERTVLFEEVGDLAPAVQDSLVRLMGVPALCSALRFITTTSRDLNDLAARQVVRADLLYRLDVVRLPIPLLRERPSDTIFLADHFCTLAARYFRREVRTFASDARACLLHHPWPGNVRELRNCILESVLHSAHVVLRAADLRVRPAPSTAPEAELSVVLAKLQASCPSDFYAHTQRLVLQWALDACDGNRIRAATLLGIGRGSLRAKLRRYGLDRPDHDNPPPFAS